MFGVTKEAVAAAEEGNMQNFVQALEKDGKSAEGKPEGSKPSAKKEDKKDDDESMQLD